MDRYRKTSVPAWQKRVLVLLGALFGATLLLFITWAVLLSTERATGDEKPVDDRTGSGGSIRAALRQVDQRGRA